MSQEAFVQAVKSKLAEYQKNLEANRENPRELEQWEWDLITKVLGDMHKNGYSPADAFRYWASTEYINPYLAEDEGIRRMKAIRDKYTPKAD